MRVLGRSTERHSEHRPTPRHPTAALLRPKAPSLAAHTTHQAPSMLSMHGTILMDNTPSHIVKAGIARGSRSKKKGGQKARSPPDEHNHQQAVMKVKIKRCVSWGARIAWCLWRGGGRKFMRKAGEFVAGGSVVDPTPPDLLPPPPPPLPQRPPS